jgi:hypothetical protein
MGFMCDYFPNRISRSYSEAYVFSKARQRRSALILFILYSLDSVWKVAHWEEFTSVVRESGWWGTPLFALALTIRFAIMGFILFLYLRLKKVSQEPPAVTRPMKDASVRSMRIIHIFLLAAIVMYALVAERLFQPASRVSTQFVEFLWFLAGLIVVIAFGLRWKLLPSATKELQGNSSDTSALGRWRIVNLLSMILAMTVSLFGIVLRIMGGSRLVVWPLFIASVLLMLLWRPRLYEGATPVLPSPN